MIGIYQDSFGEYIEEHIGKYKVTNNNIICKCPWCDYVMKSSTKNHLYISLEKPIFHCFRAGCGKSGTIKKFIKKISGTYLRNTYIDEKEFRNKNGSLDTSKSKLKSERKFIIPKLMITGFSDKRDYLISRLQYADINIKNIHGLVFDVEQFVTINKLQNNLSLSDKKMMPYLQKKFVGFITENHTKIVFRNIEIDTSFRYYKLNLQQSDFLDYYKITHHDYDSKTIVISEGIFDIFNDHIFDYLGYRDRSYAYYCALSNRFESLIKSIAYHDNLYNPKVVILSDNNVSVKYYKQMKKRLKNWCSSIELYYNVNGDDFGDTFCTPEKIMI